MFTNEEIKILNSVTESFSKRAKHAYLQPFDEFVNEWYKFIEEVEHGYEMTINDYTNELTTRDLIDELLGKVPEDLRKKVEALVDPWDKRFDAATTVLNEPIFREDDPPRWWYRLPKKLTGELKEDVQALKIK